MLSKNIQSATSTGINVSDVFNTSLYSGNGSTQTITNNIDLFGKGGLVWIKSRTTTGHNHCLFDTVRGVRRYLFSNLDNAQFLDASNGVSSFNSNGFTVLDGSGSGRVNQSGDSLVSWTFRKARKFFDVISYTGDGATDKILSHSLGIEPGLVIIKSISASARNWIVQHKDLQATREYFLLNSAAAANATLTAPTAISWANSTEIVVHGSWPTGTGNDLNTNGVQYIAYLFAHDPSSSGIIKCGTFSTNISGSGSFDTGWSQGAQFIILKAVGASENWEMYDTQRTPSWSSTDSRLRPNVDNAEDLVTRLSASGSTLSFTNLSSSQTYIYLVVAAP